jgi:hypothetical protein
MGGTYQLQVSSSLYASGATTINAQPGAGPLNPQNTARLGSPYSFYIVIVSEGTVTITENRCIPQIGVMSKQDVLNLDHAPIAQMPVSQNANGGDFLSGLKNMMHKLMPVLKASPAEHEGPKSNLESVGEGMKKKHKKGKKHKKDDMMGGAPSGGKRHKKKKGHGILIEGGKKLTRDMLKKRLRHLMN